MSSRNLFQNKINIITILLQNFKIIKSLLVFFFVHNQFWKYSMVIQNSVIIFVKIKDFDVFQKQCNLVTSKNFLIYNY